MGGGVEVVAFLYIKPGVITYSSSISVKIMMPMVTKAAKKVASLAFIAKGGRRGCGHGED